MKNVHTEHCCKRHGCKYGDSDCPVADGLQEASFPCEDCGPIAKSNSLSTTIIAKLSYGNVYRMPDGSGTDNENLLRLAAIQYVITNGEVTNEWDEAGLFNAVRIVMKTSVEVLTSEYLDKLIEDAARY